MPKVLGRGKITVEGKEYDLKDFDDTKSFTKDKPKRLGERPGTRRLGK